jgi:DNA-binding response OmpR family regulator
MVRRNGKYTVLVIEDEPDFHDFVSRALELEGYNVLKASNGSTDLAILDEHFIDLILLDLHSPGIEGLLMLHDIKHTQGLSKTPIIIVSAHAESSYRQKSLQMGVTQYLLKPVSTEQLNKTVTSILHKKAPHYSYKKVHSLSHA